MGLFFSADAKAIETKRTRLTNDINCDTQKLQLSNFYGCNKSYGDDGRFLFDFFILFIVSVFGQEILYEPGTRTDDRDLEEGFRERVDTCILRNKGTKPSNKQ
jgi:hypothetical protein